MPDFSNNSTSTNLPRFLLFLVNDFTKPACCRTSATARINFDCGNNIDGLPMRLAFFKATMKLDKLSFVMILPGRFFDTGNHPFVSVFAKTDSTQTKIPHEAIFATTAKTASDNPTAEFRFFKRSGYDRFFCHIDQNESIGTHSYHKGNKSAVKSKGRGLYLSRK